MLLKYKAEYWFVKLKMLGAALFWLGKEQRTRGRFLSLEKENRQAEEPRVLRSGEGLLRG